MTGSAAMYRVVLIDDEELILEGLRTVVQWQDYGCEVVGTANDAITGIALIRDTRPDILFTDIRMPGKDGLSMLAGLRSEYPDMQVTILSGYSDFSYAQEAIKLGVTRFILKPSKMSDINEALSVMTFKLSERERRQSAVSADVPLRLSTKTDIELEKKQEKTAENRAEEDMTEYELHSNESANFIVVNAIRYMEDHYAQKLTLQEVADGCYVSQWHLSKLLSKYKDKSFYDILNEIRIRHAKELLLSPGLKISEISDMVGYTDPAHFAKVFRKIVGISANEYRNKIKS